MSRITLAWIPLLESKLYFLSIFISSFLSCPRSEIFFLKYLEVCRSQSVNSCVSFPLFASHGTYSLPHLTRR
jgi:hypothetical protein